MTKLSLIFSLLLISACSFMDDNSPMWENPDFTYIASHVKVVDKSPTHVVYEYKDIRVDEIAPIAAIYCHDRGGKQASLYEIITRPDNYRRAVFACRKLPDFR
ncbi:MAG: hypothetical protein E7012_00050 [Alphaproteobacteria bacterium]|nr:hypothetical protein [Alphaproteobacteria bacterium]